MPTKPLSKKQLEVIRAIAAYRRKHSYSPTLTELMRILGLRSINAVYSRLVIMERVGWLVRDPNLSSREFLPVDEAKPNLNKGLKPTWNRKP